MQALCCLPSPRKVTRVRSTDEKGKRLSVAGPPAYDFIANEGADYQQRIWQVVLEEKRVSVDEATKLVNRKDMVNDITTPETYLQSLTAAYNENGFAQRMPRIREIFESIEPFTQAICSMAQSDAAASLLWGSVMLVFQSVLRAATFWETTRQMFFDLSRQLPRFHAYAHILHTPRLHDSLRRVYSLFIDFCVQVVDCLMSPQICSMLRLQWTSFDAEYQRAATELRDATVDFKEEVHLAHVQDGFQKHAEVLNAINASSVVGFRTNITLPRNERFTGRDDFLALLHSILEPSFQERLEERTARSALIHALGGMGKTETALEYTYRFRQCYDCILWLRAESRTVLMESFLGVINLLGIAPDHTPTNRKVQMGLQWFQSSGISSRHMYAYFSVYGLTDNIAEKKWLLVYDNAESLATVREFWPATTRGTIIITSQNPEFQAMTSSHIHMKPMLPEEGSALIQAYLSRGGSEKDATLKLAASLGGLPLAIVHFTGYIAKSQAPIAQIAASFDQRLRSSQIWKAQDLSAEARAYAMTLATVWDLAIRRLSSDARKLLEFIAFLDPDQINTDLFIGIGNESRDSNGWKYWDIDRFNVAVSILCERHLVERYTQESFDSLRTHRALQRSILQNLDEDVEHRDQVFLEVVSIMRKACPLSNYVKRSESSQFPIFARCLPHIIALHRNYRESMPHINANLQFAEVLRDAGNYGTLSGNSIFSEPLLRLGMEICDTLPASLTVQRLLCNIMAALQDILQGRGTAGRTEAFQMASRIHELRRQEMDGVPKDQWTDIDVVNWARGTVDLGCALVQLNKIEEGNERFEEGINLYSQNEVFKIRLFHARSLNLCTLAIMQRKSETREQAEACIKFIEGELGTSDYTTLKTKSYSGHAFFTIGDVDRSCELHKDAFEQYLQVNGNNDHTTLGSQYCLAVCLQRQGLLQEARTHLTKILETGVVTETWRLEDIERTKFRLYLVERDLRNVNEAGSLLDQVQKRIYELRESKYHLSMLRPEHNRKEFTNEDDMALLDSNVVLWHGRTAGMWSSGGEIW